MIAWFSRSEKRILPSTFIKTQTFEDVWRSRCRGSSNGIGLSSRFVVRLLFLLWNGSPMVPLRLSFKEGHHNCSTGHLRHSPPPLSSRELVGSHPFSSPSPTRFLWSMAADIVSFSAWDGSCGSSDVRGPLRLHESWFKMIWWLWILGLSDLVASSSWACLIMIPLSLGWPSSAMGASVG